MYLYENSLYFLGLSYLLKGDYIMAYNICEELLPLLKGKYQKSPEENMEDYSNCLGNQSFHCIFLGYFAKAEKYAREGLKIDSSQTFIYSNLAASLLLQGKYAEAEEIYRKYKPKLKEAFLEDFKNFEEAGIIPNERRKDVEKIKALLNE